jgi:phage terminase large subunit
VQAKVFDNQTLMQADPEYVKRLQDLPEHLKKAYLDGDWNIFAGQAFPQLSYDTHLVEPFDLPPNTRYIAGYDHGYNHPFSFVLLGITPDGTVYVTQHYSSRLLEVPEIAKGIKEHLRGRKVQIFAGHDLWYPGRGGGASVFEQFQDNGVTGFIRAKIDRVQGVAQIRKYISLLHGKPQLFFFKTSTVLDLFNTVAGMQYDPKNPEDVVKVDAIDGVGGDDSYDAFRYALMSRATPNSPFAEPPKVFSGNWILESLASKEDDDY